MKLPRSQAIPVPEISREEMQKEKEELSSGRMRIKIMGLLLAILLLIALGAFASSAMATNARSFPIMMDPNRLETASISLSEDESFADPTVHLEAPVPVSFDNISGFDLPPDLDGEERGCHNGANYIAYTFFVRNSGDGDCSLSERMGLSDSGKGADKAVRIRVYRDGMDMIYAAAGDDGIPEVGTVPFTDNETVFDTVSTLAAGKQRKYTIVIWLEGDDPDCTDEIKGGTVRFFLDFTAGEN